MTTPTARTIQADDRSVVDRFIAIHRGAEPLAVLDAQYNAGLAWPHFRPGWGGMSVSRGLSRTYRAALRESGIPPSPASFVGLNQVAALIHDLDRTDLRDRFMRRIFTGEDQWCQLFSEPGAGSDLANVATSAVRTDTGWLITGQKVWTSNARHADQAILLARTDPSVPKHRGLSMFLVAMSAPGLQVRPLRQADGGSRFSEVYLDGVVVNDDQLLGEVGDGWALAMQVLGNERESASAVFLRPTDDLLKRWRNRPAIVPGALRDDVIKLWIEARIIALTTQRQRTTSDTIEAGRLASLGKIAASEHSQRYGDLLAAVVGPAVLVDADYTEAETGESDRGAAAVKDFSALSPHRFVIRSRAMSIEGGTNEISRNLIGERVLGLPPDVRVDKTVAWRDLARS